MDSDTTRDSIGCPRCEAKSGEVCRTPSGRRVEGQGAHAERLAAVAATRRVGALDGLGGVPTFVEATPQDVRDSSVCILIDTSRFSVRRAVPRSEVNVEATTYAVPTGDREVDQDVVTVAKELLDSPELRAIATHDHYTKRWIRAHSVPSPLLRAGAFLVSVDALAEVYEYLERRRDERAALIAQFTEVYPQKTADARKRLGPLFDPTQYPAASVIAGAFGLEWQVVEMGTPDSKLRAVSKALFERERDKAEKVWANAVGQINEMLAAGMAKVVGHLAEKLGGADGEKPKRFRESSIAHVTEFFDTFGSRNLTRNADLAALVDKGRKLLSGVDAKELKSDDKLRARVAAGFVEINASLGKMLENRPARAITLEDEEAV